MTSNSSQRASSSRPRPVTDYTVACVCPMGVELAPVKAMLDNIHPDVPTQRDQNSYVLGDMAGHNVVIAVLPEIGTNAAATVAIQLLNDFPSIRFGLLVGIGGGVPDSEEEEEEDSNDIRLGDVVVSKPTNRFGGVVQYDLGKYTTKGGFEQTGLLSKPPSLLRSKVEQLRADHDIYGNKISSLLSTMLERYPAMQDKYLHQGAENDLLFSAGYSHVGSRSSCRGCDRKFVVERESRRNNDPKIHYGTIGSANMVVKDANLREQLRQEMDLMCIEMEAAGLMNDFPCLVIRGICDYSDSHKNKRWQPYAAATAAAYAKELLSVIVPKETAELAPASNAIQVPKYDLGLNLFDAPGIDDHQFVGREEILTQIHTTLQPDSKPPDRKVLVLGGMGGIGKTQLAIAYAKRYRQHYLSTFWINASSITTLQSSFRIVARRIGVTGSKNSVDADDDQILTSVLNWLSELDNSRWLLIFDNYDEPDQFSISSYFAYEFHGSIIITSRLPDQVPGSPIHVAVQSFESIDDGLDILSRRSQRDNVHEDVHARQLATRLAGLPLALATAGAFLHKSKSTWSFERYLEVYKDRWQIDPRRPLQLSEYDKTLYTTWNLSYANLESKDPDAAQLLKLMAYFDNQAIWYDLLHAGTRADLPKWLRDVSDDSVGFESAMRVLVDYSFLEVRTATSAYSMHMCVHDWALGALNQTIDTNHYWYAFDCVAKSINPDDWNELGYMRYASLTPHAVRLMNSKFEKVWEELTMERLSSVDSVGQLLAEQMRLDANVTNYTRALIWCEKSLGPEHTVTLITLNQLGETYHDQQKLDEAEKIYLRALAGKEKTLGLEDTLTLQAVNCLGILYEDQEKLDKAEQMYSRALAGYEKSLGPDDTSVLDVVHNFGRLYHSQGKLDESEQMYLRALEGSKRALGPDDITILDTVRNLGYLYCDQGRLEEGEQMYRQVLTGYEKTLGPEHLTTLQAVSDLAEVYEDRDKLDDAEQMYLRALAGREKVLGLEHPLTLDIIYNLGSLYQDREDKLDEAERMFLQVLTGYEKAVGPDHMSTVEMVNSLGEFYVAQSRHDEADRMYSRARASFRKILDQSDPPRKAAIQGYANVLSMSVALSILDSAIASDYVVCLAQHFQRWGLQDLVVAVALAKALIKFRDDENAQVAFVHSHPITNKYAMVFNDLVCDSCDVELGCKVGCHTCRTCLDVDLCNECKTEYANEELDLETCSGHEHADLGSMVSIAQNRDQSPSTEETELWLGQLVKRYQSEKDMVIR